MRNDYPFVKTDINLYKFNNGLGEKSVKFYIN